MCLGMPILNACSFFREASNEAVGIKEVLVEYDENGNANITIYYTDKNKEPTPIVLEKGQDGEIGNGIKEIKYKTNEDETTTLIIYYTDESREPDYVVLKPGTYIKAVRCEPEFDSEGKRTGNTLIIFTDSEGNDLPGMPVYKGDTGKDGNGIDSIEPLYNNDGSTTLIITFDDGTTREVPCPAPNGVESIDARKEGNKYHLIINFTNGDSVDIDFDAPSSWDFGNHLPDPTEYFDGDYFFDEQRGIIYRNKNSEEWVIVTKFKSEDTTYAVSFELNADDAAWVDPINEPHYFPNVKNGSTFYSLNYSFPQVYRSGYVFSGWSTSPIHKPTNGLFTDLTPVLSDMTLYAVWTN